MARKQAEFNMDIRHSLCGRRVGVALDIDSGSPDLHPARGSTLLEPWGADTDVTGAPSGWRRVTLRCHPKRCGKLDRPLTIQAFQRMVADAQARGENTIWLS